MSLRSAFSRFLLPGVSIAAIAGAAALVPDRAGLGRQPAARGGRRLAGHLLAGSPGSAVAHLSAAAQVAAAERCAQWAANAGFENNGYMGGSLTTIVAIGLFESGCNPAACHDNTHPSVACSQGHEPAGDNVDRGAFQLNSVAWKTISDKCAYNAVCAAAQAYLHVST